MEKPDLRIFVSLYPNIGDVVNQTPLLKSLRIAYPESRIVAMTSQLALELLQNNPNIDEIWTRPKGLSGKVGRVLRMRRERFDLAILTCRHHPTLLTCGIGGVRRIIGVHHNKHKRLLDAEVAIPKGERVVAGLSRLILDSLGIASHGDQPDIYLQSSDRDLAARLIESRGWVAVQVGASSSRKEWSIDRFQQIWRALAEDGFRIVMIGGTKEAIELSRLGAEDAIRIVAGSLTLLQTAAVLERVEVLLTNDTGPMHLAAAVGTPVVAMYGPTTVDEHAPFGQGHQLIQGLCDCPSKSPATCRGSCMESIGVSAVLQACRQAIQDRATGTVWTNEDPAGA